MVVVIFAHPYPRHSQAGRALISNVRDLSDVQVRDLYELYPDFVIDPGAEQTALERAQTIVLQHPLYWYQTPALLTLWFEKVLTAGWAFGERTQLARKRLLWVPTTGASAEAYNGHDERTTMTALAAPLMRLAHFCGMTWLPPIAVHRAGQLTDAELAAEGQRYRQVLTTEVALARQTGVINAE